MKFGFFGNANNFPFMLARALKEKGHDVLFIIDRMPSQVNGKLNRPEEKYDDISIPYPEWIKDISPVNLWEFPNGSAKRKKVVNLLKTQDFLILNEFGLILANEVNKPTIAWLTGTDVEDLADINYANKIAESIPIEGNLIIKIKRLIVKKLVKNHYRKLVLKQRNGIRTSLIVNFFARGFIPHADRILDEIGVPDSRRTFLLMTDVLNIKFEIPPENKILKIFCVARFTWIKKKNKFSESELNLKGSDIMIKALGTYLNSKDAKKLEIIFVKKGEDVIEAMKLVKDVGIEMFVKWVPEMSQKEVLNVYKNSDIIFDQLGNGMISMGTLDAMAIGRPVIANGRPEILSRYISAPSPLCQAKSEPEVLEHIIRLVNSSTLRREIGLTSREYVEKYFSARNAADQILKKLNDEQLI